MATIEDQRYTSNREAHLFAVIAISNLASYHLEPARVARAAAAARGGSASASASTDAPGRWVDLASRWPWSHPDDEGKDVRMDSLNRMFDLLELVWSQYSTDRRLATHCVRGMGHLAAQFVCSSQLRRSTDRGHAEALLRRVQERLHELRENFNDDFDVAHHALERAFERDFLSAARGAMAATYESVGAATARPTDPTDPTDPTNAAEGAAREGAKGEAMGDLKRREPSKYAAEAAERAVAAATSLARTFSDGSVEAGKAAWGYNITESGRMALHTTGSVGGSGGAAQSGGGAAQPSASASASGLGSGSGAVSVERSVWLIEGAVEDGELALLELIRQYRYVVLIQLIMSKFE